MRIIKRTRDRVSELRSEYHFDYAKARPNRFARHWTGKSHLVVLVDEDMARIYKTPQAVNHALRSLVEAVTRSRRRRAA